MSCNNANDALTFHLTLSSAVRFLLIIKTCRTSNIPISVTCLELIGKYEYVTTLNRRYLLNISTDIVSIFSMLMLTFSLKIEFVPEYSLRSWCFMLLMKSFDRFHMKNSHKTFYFLAEFKTSSYSPIIFQTAGTFSDTQPKSHLLSSRQLQVC